MAVEITIPSPGESITEVTLGKWHKSDGDWVEKDENLVELESDKATLDLPAPESGILKITAQEGEDKEVGDVIGTIDPDGEQPPDSAEKKSKKKAEAGGDDEDGDEDDEKSTATATKSRPEDSGASKSKENGQATADSGSVRATPVARKMADEQGIRLSDIKGTGPSGRVTKSDVLAASKSDGQAGAEPAGKDEQKGDDRSDRAGDGRAPTLAMRGGSRESRLEKMTKLRRRIAQRLVQAQQTAAMLTTFNEADMSAVMALRKKYKEDFAKKYDINLGFMSFFVRACVSALREYPRVNAYIVEDSIEFHDYVDISVAVSTPKGLVVPVIRNAEQLSFAEIELAIKDLAERARDGKLTIEEMTGGTFTITNGGIFGSLNSTPILNPPQSGILGMHAIKNRPVEHPDKPGEIALRPMMYLALSYDHRIVDGAEAVGFLVHVRDMLESPERLLLEV